MNNSRAWLAAWLALSRPALIAGLLASTTWAAERTSAPGAPTTEKPPATVGGKSGDPSAPVKVVEEPVFQLPELVIIGENQARIMAQKEQLTPTPLKGLHEAPLLEKEEGGVTALRQREPVSGVSPVKAGKNALVKVEAGNAGWLGGAGWFGVQRETRFVGVELSGSRLTGVPVGLGHASGWDTAAMLHAGNVTPERTQSKTGTERWLQLGMVPDTGIVEVGMAIQSRELPYVSTASRRRLSRFWLEGDASEEPAGTASRGRINLARVELPTGPVNGLGLAVTHGRHVWSRGAMIVRVRGRFEAEAAGRTGTFILPGALLLAEWVPGERFRGEAGVNAEGVFGGGTSAGSMRPVGGLSWTLPAGPTVSARFAPSLNAPWLTRAAVENPYSAFTSRLVPERELANAELSAWHGWNDGTAVRGTYRFTEIRNAATWVERPGQGVWEPAHIPGLRTQELTLDGTMPIEMLGDLLPGSRWAVTAGGKWRTLVAVTAPPPVGPVTAVVSMANVPRAQGTIGFTATWRTISGDLTAEVVRWRPRSADSPAELKPYMDLGFGLVWKPVGWGQAYVRISNLAGADVERWAGYPEPKALVRAGAMVSF